MILTSKRQAPLHHQHLLQRNDCAAVHLEEWHALRIRQKNQIDAKGLPQVSLADWGRLQAEIHLLGTQQRRQLAALLSKQGAERMSADNVTTTPTHKIS